MPYSIHASPSVSLSGAEFAGSSDAPIRNGSRHLRWVLGAAAACLTLAGTALAQVDSKDAKTDDKSSAQSSAEKVKATEDVLIFSDGKVVHGKILKESATTITFRSQVGGLPFETEYQKADILTIKRDQAIEGGGATPAQDDAAAPVEATGAKQKVYYIDWVGEFGLDVTQTPIRRTIEDARRQNADVIIIRVDTKFGDNPFEETPGDAVIGFDQIFRAGPIMPIFINEIPRTWAKQPRVVFWVKQAMSGSSLVPLVSPEIYFASESRLGGIRGIQEMLASRGDEVVRQKQYSLRMATAEGWAIVGGYDYRIVRAMADATYVLSYKFDGGQVQLLERLPESPDEFLLTDDGKADEGRADTIEQVARGEGNDVLTINAPTAEALGISDGTVDRLDDLIFRLGLARVAEVDEKSGNRIMQNWVREYIKARKDIQDELERAGNIQVDGQTVAERRRQRGTQIAALEKVLRILKQYEEIFTPQYRVNNRIPPQNSDLYVEIERLRIQQIMDEGR